jgi:hypothetical protein
VSRAGALLGAQGHIQSFDWYLNCPEDIQGLLVIIRDVLKCPALVLSRSNRVLALRRILHAQFSFAHLSENAPSGRATPCTRPNLPHIPEIVTCTTGLGPAAHSPMTSAAAQFAYPDGAAQSLTHPRDPLRRRATPQRNPDPPTFPAPCHRRKEVEANAHDPLPYHRVHVCPRRAPARHRGKRHSPRALDGGVERANAKSHSPCSSVACSAYASTSQTRPPTSTSTTEAMPQHTTPIGRSGS